MKTLPVTPCRIVLYTLARDWNRPLLADNQTPSNRAGMSYPLLVTSVLANGKVNGVLFLDNGLSEFVEEINHGVTPLEPDHWTWPGDVPVEEAAPIELAEEETSMVDMVAFPFADVLLARIGEDGAVEFIIKPESFVGVKTVDFDQFKADARPLMVRRGDPIINMPETKDAELLDFIEKECISLVRAANPAKPGFVGYEAVTKSAISYYGDTAREALLKLQDALKKPL